MCDNRQRVESKQKATHLRTMNEYRTSNHFKFTAALMCQLWPTKIHNTVSQSILVEGVKLRCLLWLCSSYRVSPRLTVAEPGIEVWGCSPSPAFPSPSSFPSPFPPIPIPCPLPPLTFLLFPFTPFPLPIPYPSLRIPSLSPSLPIPIVAAKRHRKSS